MEAEPGGSDPPCNLALDGVEIGTVEVAGDRSPAVRELAVGVEPGEKQREVALPDPAALGMELLERLRELVAELLDRPVRDRPAHPAVITCLPRQPLLIEQAALLVLAATAARARCVPGSLRHRPERYEQERTASRPGAGRSARYSAWPSRPCPETTCNTGSTRLPREVDRLRAENERLRTLLALTQPTKTILDQSKPDPPHSPPLAPASADEKIALMRCLFRGREDVYALRWESARTGKSGYAPATAEGWSRHRPEDLSAAGRRGDRAPSARTGVDRRLPAA